ncbi:FAD/NAD(P)-binding domain-containing protein [Mycena kentingensis (nom. inval.)]|nr:FAD/NAD(P)-binding domain-containing protein [Mycena kentingensis (nom. inval.)]
MTKLKTVVVVGGSYTGTYVVDRLAPLVYKTHHIVLIEKSSHFQHVFAFPRVSVVPGFEQKAFVPYTNAFHQAPRDAVSVVHGVVENILPNCVVLTDGQVIEYEYLVIATGTGRPPLHLEWKAAGMEVKRTLQERIREAQEIVVVGGGAYGLRAYFPHIRKNKELTNKELAFDAKELYPHKNVTLVHSRSHLMPHFHPRLHTIVMTRARTLGVRILLGRRAKIPREGFPTDGPRYTVALTDGTFLPADVALACIGGVPLSSPMFALSPGCIHPRTQEILVQPTMQITDTRFPRVFAVGDVAATNAHKSSGSGHRQAAVAVQNIEQMIRGERPESVYLPGQRKIRLSLGLHSYVTFKNPEEDGGSPSIKFMELNDANHDAAEITQLFECRAQTVWERRALGVTDYYL